MEAWFLLAVCVATTGGPFTSGCTGETRGGNYFYATEAECLQDAPNKIVWSGLTKAGVMCVRGQVFTAPK